MLEHKKQNLLPFDRFLKRMLKHGLIAALIICLSLMIGMLGYHLTAELSWLDAFLNASMILTGMGPVANLSSDAAKLFAGFYALYSGIAFLTVVGILVAPVAHRMLHKFHLDKQ